jgi:hypothetical protein
LVAIRTELLKQQRSDGRRIVTARFRQLVRERHKALRNRLPKLRQERVKQTFLSLGQHIVARRNRKLRDRTLGKSLQHAQTTTLLRSDKDQRFPAATGASGSSDSMYVGIEISREIKVDDVADVIDVEAARGDIGCNHHTDSLITQTLQNRRTLSLRQITVERFRCDSF